MKTYYILLILLLSFSSANAQETFETSKMESTVMAFENNEDVSLNVAQVETESSVIMEFASEAILVRTSDIRTYLNQIRNVENIDLLFPKINKTVKV